MRKHLKPTQAATAAIWRGWSLNWPLTSAGSFSQPHRKDRRIALERLALSAAYLRLGSGPGAAVVLAGVPLADFVGLPDGEMAPAAVMT
jgi:hypothetical protein